MNLNAGCGNNFWGDIRLDINPEAKAATHIMDIQNIEWPKNYFFETRCISVLEHIPDWKKALSELCRVTQHKIVIEVPVNSDLRKTEIFRLLWPTPKNLKLLFNLKERAKETLWQFKPEVIAKILRSYGFTVGWAKIIQRYAGSISRCWRIVGVRLGI